MSERVPEGWQTVRVKDIFSLNTKLIAPNNFPREKFAYFSLPAFDEFHSSVVVCGDKIESNKFSIDVDSILISKLNPRKPRVMLAKPKGHRACASTEFISYVAKKSEDVSLSYFKHFFFSDIFHGRLQLAATGSTNSHVRVLPSETISWKIIIPPLPEQKKIASILTSVDEVTENTRAQINKLQDLKKALMQDLLTKGIGHTKFKNSELGQIPKNWVESYVSDFFDFSIGGTPSRNNESYWDLEKARNNKWVTIKDLKGKYIDDTKEYISDEGVKKSNVKLIPSGTVVMSFKLTIGRLSITKSPLYTNEAIVGFMSKSNASIDRDFLYYGLQSWDLLAEVDQAVKGVTLNKDKMSRIIGLFPPLPEQKKIASILTSVDEMIENTQAQINKLQSLKKALMHDLLTGKVRVSS